jgi:TATA-box binding protein (TBP) (component of TFIID and TFIIIB)
VFPATTSKARLQLKQEQPVPEETESVYPLRINLRKRAKKHSILDLIPLRGFVTATNSLFESGQIITSGGVSLSANRMQAYQFVRRLSQDLQLPLRIYNLCTNNLVCSTDLGFELNLQWMAQESDLRGWEVYYNDEEFKGASMATADPTIVFVFFESGKVIATGMKSMTSVPIAEKRMRDRIAIFRKGTEPPSFDPTRTQNRDAETLERLRNKHLQSKEPLPKDNAAKRSQKRMSAEMMRAIRKLCAFLLEPDAEAEETDSYDFSL